MCGITGILNFNGNAKQFRTSLINSVEKLKLRGPNNFDFFINENVGLGHTRLAVIDTSQAGNQPFFARSKNYAIVFNGEFFNYKTYKKELEADGVNFISESDTEVLLYLLIKHGTKAIEKINGCFAFVFYDFVNNQCIMARDRFGIKPLFYYTDHNNLFFASELKSLLEYPIPRKLNYEALKTYFQLNYIPINQCIIEDVKKLNPGSYLLINGRNKIRSENYYKIDEIKKEDTAADKNYTTTCTKLYELLDNSVKMRLVADVPVGCFLSGGIDSSIITALAANHTKKLNTFSIGFTDNKFFDETGIAEIVAEKFNTNHTTFKVSNKDLLENITNVLDYLDEPFADSSALAVGILSKLTRSKVTVALSGDGGDEIFAGYNKHSALLRMLNPGIKEKIVANLNYLWKILPKSRNSKISNTFRQLYRFSNVYKLSSQERYWNLASIGSEKYIGELLLTKTNEEKFQKLKNEYINFDFTNINEILRADIHLVLSGDMLVKTDLMSMSNSLEVRVPFLDHNIVDFAFSFPDSYKITKNIRKKILRDTFKNILPEEIFLHKKHGFEVPITYYLQTDINYLVEKFLNEKFIKEQNIFKYETIKKLKKQIYSSNPDDSAAKIWALICFQNFWNKFCET